MGKIANLQSFTTIYILFAFEQNKLWLNIVHRITIKVIVP